MDPLTLALIAGGIYLATRKPKEAPAPDLVNLARDAVASGSPGTALAQSGGLQLNLAPTPMPSGPTVAAPSSGLVPSMPAATVQAPTAGLVPVLAAPAPAGPVRLAPAPLPTAPIPGAFSDAIARSGTTRAGTVSIDPGAVLAIARMKGGG